MLSKPSSSLTRAKDLQSIDAAARQLYAALLRPVESKLRGKKRLTIVPDGVLAYVPFEAIGGFDEAYRIPSVEDIELGYRLRRAGHRIRLEATWQVKHLKRWQLRDLIVTDIGRRAIPWKRLLRREGRLDNDLNIDHASRVNAALVCGGGALLALGSLWRPGVPAGALLLGAAVTRNIPFYRFLGRTGGWALAVGSVPLHWLYFAGATVGFLLGRLRSDPR